MEGGGTHDTCQYKKMPYVCFYLACSSPCRMLNVQQSHNHFIFFINYMHVIKAHINMSSIRNDRVTLPNIAVHI